VVVACLCSLMSISLLPDELVKKLLGGQQRITSIAHLIIRDPTTTGQKKGNEHRFMRPFLTTRAVTDLALNPRVSPPTLVLPAIIVST
ncbi:hypothetical protein, partial [Chromohalobacter japonicus]|uniref:hypothetical protein n=1 Tax=Chromohalobacter japonicus TaxID=223900 RepID=UPI0035E709EB